MISLDYKMIVLKMIRKMPDSGTYAINTEHPNSIKFIEAVKTIINEKWTGKFKKAFSVYFNVQMNKILKVDHPRRGIWRDYFDMRKQQNELTAKMMESKTEKDERVYTTHTLKGIAETREVWLGGEQLDPEPSKKVINHSPDGFNWGYAGSGPAQLALAIILKLTGKSDGYHDFKYDTIAKIPQGEDFEIEFKLLRP